MGIELYPYQTKIIEEIRTRWKSGQKRILVQSPTGSGKTVIFSWIASRGKRILILTHRTELLTETGGTLQDFGIVPALVTSETRTPPQRMVAVAMSMTLKNRVKNDPWSDWLDTVELIIVDECHQQDFDYIVDLCPDKFILGFTATPKRKGNQRQLSDMYQSIVTGPDVQELINLKYLVPDRYFGAPINLKGVGKDSFGEYKSDELFNRFNTPELYTGLIDNWRRLAPGSLTLVFCVNIQHCINTARAFNFAGIRAKFLTSEVARPEEGTPGYATKLAEWENYQQTFSEMSGSRAEVINTWKSRDYDVLINAGILTTGFNHKPIETIVINRATTSENLWLQIIGRGSRTSPGKSDFRIMDFGSNADRLGHYRQQREYSLTHYVSSRKDGVQSVKDCPGCGALVIASTRYCKYCGHEFQKTKHEKAVELVEKDFEEMRAGLAIQKQQTIEQIEIAAAVKGYKSAWIWRQIYFKFGADEFKKYMRSKNYQWPFIYRKLNEYEPVRSVRK